MTDTRGILHPKVGFEHFALRRREPGPRLQPYVDRLWCVSWDLPPGEVFEQPILAHPCVNVVVELHRAAVYGVPSRVMRQRLEGRGWAVAAMFAPGGARPFLGGPARAWVDRNLEVGSQWGAPGQELVTAIRAADGSAPEQERRVALLSDFLAELVPPRIPAGTADVIAAARLVSDDRRICRVEQLAERTGVGQRTLQRLFAEHIGLSPKKVIRRYRLLEAAEAAATQAVSWAHVAAQLGYSDQAHLTRDFTAAFGVPPGRYAADAAAPAAGRSAG